MLLFSFIKMLFGNFVFVSKKSKTLNYTEHENKKHKLRIDKRRHHGSSC